MLSDRTRFSLFLDVAVDGAGEGVDAPIFEFRLVTTLTSASDKVTLCPDQSPRARASSSFCVRTQILFDSKKDLVALQRSICKHLNRAKRIHYFNYLEASQRANVVQADSSREPAPQREGLHDVIIRDLIDPRFNRGIADFASTGTSTGTAPASWILA